MWDRYDPRSDDGRDRGGTWDRDRGNRGGSSERDCNGERDPRDVFTTDVDLPRGRERRPVRERDRVYEINGSESRMLGTIGAFRVVSESDLHHLRDDSNGARRSVRRLGEEGLIRTSPLSSEDRAVVLTERGRDLLEANRFERHDREHEPRQAFYAGLRKPRELTHDTKVYRAYQRAEERLRDGGGGSGESSSTTNSSVTISVSCTSAIEARRTVTVGRTGSPKRLHTGRGNTSCRTTMGTSGSRTRGSSTRTETAARGTRILRSSPLTTAAPTPAPPGSQASPATFPSDVRSVVAAAADGGQRTRESRRN